MERKRPSMPLAQARSVNTGRRRRRPSRDEQERIGMPGMTFEGGRRRVVRGDDEDVRLEGQDPGQERVEASIAATLASNLPSSPVESVFL